MEAELVGHLRDGHGIRQVLLVGEHQHDGLTQLVLGEHPVQLVVGLAHAVLVVGVNDEDQALGVLVVVAPERADLVLASDVPHGERDVLVLDGLDVETDGRDRGHDLAELQLVQDGGLAGGVKANLRSGRRGGVSVPGAQLRRDAASRKGGLRAGGGRARRLAPRTMRIRISCFPTSRPRAFANTPPIFLALYHPTLTARSRC